MLPPNVLADKYTTLVVALVPKLVTIPCHNAASSAYQDVNVLAIAQSGTETTLVLLKSNAPLQQSQQNHTSHQRNHMSHQRHPSAQMAECQCPSQRLFLRVQEAKYTTLVAAPVSRRASLLCHAIAGCVFPNVNVLRIALSGTENTLVFKRASVLPSL